MTTSTSMSSPLSAFSSLLGVPVVTSSINPIATNNKSPQSPPLFSPGDRVRVLVAFGKEKRGTVLECLFGQGVGIGGGVAVRAYRVQFDGLKKKKKPLPEVVEEQFLSAPALANEECSACHQSFAETESCTLLQCSVCKKKTHNACQVQFLIFTHIASPAVISTMRICADISFLKVLESEDGERDNGA